MLCVDGRLDSGVGWYGSKPPVLCISVATLLDWHPCRGRIEQDGTPEEIMQQPNSPFVMHFTGDVNQMPSDHEVKRNVAAQPRAQFHTS